MAMGGATYRSVLKEIWGAKGVGGLYQARSVPLQRSSAAYHLVDQLVTQMIEWLRQLLLRGGRQARHT